VLRTDDWVEEVRRRAERALEERLRAENADALVATLPLLERLAARTRLRASGVIEAAERVLSTTTRGVAALGRGLRTTEHRNVRRACAGLVRRRAELAPYEFRSSLEDRDALVRARIAGAVFERSPLDELQQILPSVLDDRSAHLRMLAFHTAKIRCPELLRVRFGRLVLDDNAWIREFARQSLGRRDFRAVYVETLRTGSARERRAALAG